MNIKDCRNFLFGKSKLIACTECKQLFQDKDLGRIVWFERNIDKVMPLALDGTVYRNPVTGKIDDPSLEMKERLVCKPCGIIFKKVGAINDHFWDEADKDVLKNSDNPEIYTKFREEEKQIFKATQKQINIQCGIEKRRKQMNDQLPLTQFRCRKCKQIYPATGGTNIVNSLILRESGKEKDTYFQLCTDCVILFKGWLDESYKYSMRNRKT